MNKKRRHELKMLKYKRRLRNYCIKDDTKGNFYSFRTTGKPCSCMVCSTYKYTRKVKHKKQILEL